MRAFLLLLLSFPALSLRSERTIVNPAWEARNTPLATVDSVLLRDTVSRFYITLKQLPHSTLTLNGDWVVTDSAGTFIGRAKDIDGVDFNRIFQFDSDSVVHIEIDFPALPPGTKRIDIVGNKKSDEIRIINLSLTDQRKPAPESPRPQIPSRAQPVSPIPEITFDTGSALLRGKLIGYHKRLNFPDGKIISTDPFTLQTTETGVSIDDDGSFAIEIPLLHPVQQKLFLKERYIPFYIEPGDTLYIQLTLDELFSPYRYSGEIEQHCSHLIYRGRNASINYELRDIRLQDTTEAEAWLKALTRLSPLEYYTTEEVKFKEKLELLGSLYHEGNISEKSRELSILDNYYKFLYHLFVYKEFKSNKIISEYNKIKNSNTLFANIPPLNMSLSVTSEYYLPFLALLESWEAMTIPPNWDYTTFIQELEARGAALSATEKEALEFIWKVSDTQPENVELVLQHFNKQYEKEQISMREERSRNLREETYRRYFGRPTDFTCQLVHTHRLIKLIQSLKRKLTPGEIKKFTITITDERLLKNIARYNDLFSPDSLTRATKECKKNENKM